MRWYETCVMAVGPWFRDANHGVSVPTSGKPVLNLSQTEHPLPGIISYVLKEGRCTMALMLKTAVVARLATAPLLAADHEPAQRLDESAAVFSEIMAAPDKGIPLDLFEKLTNHDIVTTGVRPPKAAERLLALLARYSTTERTH